MTGSQRGIRRERQVLELLRDDGWLAFRAPGSLGVADIVAVRALPIIVSPSSTIVTSQVRLIEVKSTAQGPYEHFGPADRAKLKAAAELAGATAYLAWWPSRGKLVWLEASGWIE